jgi:SSS family solute:Na+ symporter
MDYVQALFSFFIAPLFGSIILGMFWKRATKQGGFWGLLVGTAASISLWGWVKVDPSALRYVAFSPDAKAMAEDVYRAMWSFSTCVIVTVLVSLMTKARPLSELTGLVYGATAIPHERPVPLYKNHWFWASLVIVAFFVVNLVFW